MRLKDESLNGNCSWCHTVRLGVDLIQTSPLALEVLDQTYPGIAMTVKVWDAGVLDVLVRPGGWRLLYPRLYEFILSQKKGGQIQK